MQVVFAMAGSGARFRNAGYREPKPLVPVAGRPMIARLLERFPRNWKFVFLCSAEHLARSPLREVLRRELPNGTVAAIPSHHLGPVRTLLEGGAHIDDALPTLVNYCDFDFVWDAAGFERFIKETACDGAILCYHGYHPHHRGRSVYAYCRTEGDRVREVREKRPFTDDRRSEFASSGTYYFKTGALAKRYLARAARELPAVEGEHYVSEVYNLLCADGLDVRAYEIPVFLQWGTPEDLDDYLYWHRAFTHLPSPVHGRGAGGESAVPRLLMPMAGLGTRFQGFSSIPKPLLAVDGQPMFLAALERLPCRSGNPVFVAQRSVAESVQSACPQAKVLSLDGPTEGQAATCLAAKPALDPDQPVLVSACDHGILWNEERWRRLLAEEPEVVVLGQRGYPGARQSSASYSYIDAEPGGCVTGIRVKAPRSERPEQDLLLVGTFYFHSARLLFETCAKAVAQGLRKNGEFYLDGAVNLCVEAGLRVRCFETDAYLGWGSPEELQEFHYWYRYFQGLRDGR